MKLDKQMVFGFLWTTIGMFWMFSGKTVEGMIAFTISTMCTLDRD